MMTRGPNRQALAAAAPRASLKNFVSRRHDWLVAGVGTAAIAGMALFNRAAAKRAQAATPPAGSYVEVDGVRLHYVDRGEGPAVLLLHGNGVLLQDFDVSGVLPLAAEKQRVIAFDRPGFGYSDRPRATVWTPDAQARLIARALKQLGIERVVVVGHSWGTMVALAMALNAPESVVGLVLLSGYYYATARPDLISGSAPAIPVLGDVLAHTLAPLMGLLTGPIALQASFAPAPVPKKFARFPKAMTLRPSQVRATAAETALMAPAAASLGARYADLSMPVVIMAGSGDLIVDVDKHARRLAGDIVGAELRIIPDQGHLFHYAVPEQVVAAISDLASAGCSRVAV